MKTPRISVIWTIAATVAFVAQTEGTGLAQNRMLQIAIEDMTAEQRVAAKEFLGTRGQSQLSGPWVAVVRSPNLMGPLRELSDYLRFRSLPARLSEFVTMVTARHFHQQYVWSTHYDAAIKAGVPESAPQQLAEGQRPSRLSGEEEILYDLSEELHRTNRVSDRTYERAVERFGEQGVIDALATRGYYALLGMILNTVQTPAPGNAPLLTPITQPQ